MTSCKVNRFIIISHLFCRIGSYSEGELKNLRTLYEKDINQLNAEWHYFDEEYKAPGVLDNINATWFSVGTYPQGDDILELIEQPVGATYDGDLRDVLVTTNQKGILWLILPARYLFYYYNYFYGLCIAIYN